MGRRKNAATKLCAVCSDAGADSVFLPGVRDAQTIGRVVREVKCPVNILVGSGWPAVEELEKPGVAIYGPTSSGKTALSLEVSGAATERGLHPVVLNADSRQDNAGRRS